MRLPNACAAAYEAPRSPRAARGPLWVCGPLPEPTGHSRRWNKVPLTKGAFIPNNYSLNPYSVTYFKNI